MDRFRVLSDDLLIKILSFAPTKVAVSTSVLSKRWQYLWMWLPKLQFGCRDYSSSKCKMLKCFLDRNLLLHRAPVIESFHLELSNSQFEPDSIKFWLVIAIFHYLRELEVNYFTSPGKPDILPRNLFTCKSLVILKLDGGILLDVPPMVFLPSLKTLHLKSTRYFREESLQQLLSNCPILDDLLVELYKREVIRELTVVVPSLQRLSLCIPSICVIGGIVIKTPSLKYLKLVNHNMKNHYCLIENMPNLIEAYVDVIQPNIKNLIESLTFVKHLTICSKGMYDEGVVFNNLQHLQLCKCNQHLSDLLVQLLNGSPNLQVLELFKMKSHYHNEMVYWDQPSTIPACLVWSLQIFNWDGYRGTQGERDLAVYILKNSYHLRKTTIEYNEWDVPDFKMIKELELTSRASTKCKLVFEPHYTIRI